VVKWSITVESYIVCKILHIDTVHCDELKTYILIPRVSKLQKSNGKKATTTIEEILKYIKNFH
jgi:hypothetical protein